MATYFFETITAAHALAWARTDALVFSGPPSGGSDLIYGGSSKFAINENWPQISKHGVHQENRRAAQALAQNLHTQNRRGFRNWQHAKFRANAN